MSIELDIYPLTVVKDRYSGSYSGAAFTAWNVDSDETPWQIHSDDISCSDFWSEYNGKHMKYVIGKGSSIAEAVDDLAKKLEGKE